MPYFQTSEMLWSKEKSQLIKTDFLNHLNRFIETLNNAQESIDDRIFLKSSEQIDLTQVRNTSDYLSLALNSASLAIVEEMMKTWIRQMEQVEREERV